MLASAASVGAGAEEEGEQEEEDDKAENNPAEVSTKILRQHERLQPTIESRDPNQCSNSRLHHKRS